MEKGLVFALLAAVSFAVSTVNIRKATSRTGESFTAVATNVFIGVLFFAAAVFISGEWSKLWSVSGQAFISLGLAGIIHFVAGRLLAYNSYRLIGANKASAFLRSNPLFALLFAALFLNESLTIFIILGVLAIVGGAVLVSMERKSVSAEKQSRFSGTEFKGIITALGGGICWGISPILIKPAVAEIGSPVVGAFISYAVASIVMAFFFSRRQHRQQMAQLRFFTTLTPLLISGIFVSTAMLFFYMALSYIPASVAVPLLSTNIIFIYLFSFLINRSIEIFSLKIILGMLATAAGALLMFY